jgi:nucleoside-diphosphate-sugar epimerase
LLADFAGFDPWWLYRCEKIKYAFVMGLKVIITGVTGMVGEGVLLESLQNSEIDSVLAISRKALDIKNPKLKILTVADFMNIDQYKDQLAGYDACFYCAGISSNGLTEETYTKITYDTTLAFAQAVREMNPQIVFNFVSGAHTDGTEKGKTMWARVKGKTENALMAMFPGREYNFRPALMKPVPGQKHIYGYNKLTTSFLFPVLNLMFSAITLQELTWAMIRTAKTGHERPVLEVADIKKIAR